MKSILQILIIAIAFTITIKSQTATVTAGSVSAFEGDTVLVPINMANFTNVGAITIKIQIDTTVLKWSRGINWYGSMSNNGLTGRIGNQIVIAWDDLNGLTASSGKMLDLEFVYVSGTSTLSFNLPECEITDIMANPITVNYINGSVSQTPAPVAPTLISPTNNSVNNPTNINLDWNDVTNSLQYRVQLSTDNTFISIVKDTIVEISSFNISGLLNDKEYYWRVNSINPTGTSLWSTVWKFKTIVAVSNVPLLYSPVNNATDVEPEVTFKWFKSTGAQKYWIQVSLESNFNTFVVNDTSVTDTFKVVMLSYNKNYYWRAAAKNIGGTSGWSDVWTFSTIYRFNLNGIMTYDNQSNTVLNNVKVVLKKSGIITDSTVTNASGNYEFLNIVNGLYNLTPFTTKLWGGANSTDALIIRRYTAGLHTLSGLRLKCADVDNDNLVNTADGLNIKRRIVGLISSFNIGDWVFENPDININGSSVTQNIKGITSGDVNGSYTPPALLKSTVHKGQGKQKISVKEETINYPVHLDYEGKVGAISFFANFTDEVADFISIESPVFDYIYTVQEGNIKIAWDSLEGFINNSNNYIFNFVFELKDNQTIEDFNLDILPETEVADIEGTVLQGVIVNVPNMELEMPLEYKLLQNYPNPFNPSTKIKYSIPEGGRVVVNVFDILGKEVITLTNEYKDAGNYEVEFNAGNLSSGVYFYKIASGSYSEIKKMVLLR